MRDCSGNQFIGTQGELVMYRIFQKEKQYFKVTAFYALSLVKYHMKCHAHDSFEIMYVTSGECRIFCQNEWLRMKSSEFIYILPGIQHQLEITEGRPCSVLNLEFALTSEETAVEAEILLEKIQDFIVIGKPLISSQAFPPLHTGHATFTAHCVPSVSRFRCLNNQTCHRNTVLC